MIEFEPSLHSTRYIQDITPPKPLLYFDTRNDRVRQRSIGYLDAKFMQLRTKKRQVQAVDSVIANPHRKTVGYTRIPPLASLQQKRDSSLVETLLKNSELFYGIVRDDLSKTGVVVGQTIRALPWLPKKYAMSKGVYTDYNTQTFKQARWSLPVLLVASGLLLASMPWNGPAAQPGTKRSPNADATVQAQLVNAKLTDKPVNSGSGSDNPVQNTPTATAKTPAITPSVGPVTTPNIPTDVIGGIGGGEPIVEVPETPIPVTPPADPLPDPILPPVIDEVVPDITAPVLNVL